MRRPTVIVLVTAALLAAPAGAHAQQKPPEKPPAKTPETVAAAPSVPKPDGESFVVLDDGTFVAAASVETNDAEVVAQRAGGAGEGRWPREDVSVAVASGKRVHRGEEAGLHAAWKAYLQAAFIAPAGARSAKEADPPVKAAWWTETLAAADLCAKWKMKYAGTALLADGIDAGTWDDAAQTRAIEWEPTAFPFSPEDSERSKLCARWAREIVPLGGQWILRKDGVESSRSALWTQEGIALGTRNILLFSLDKDPVVAGSSLRQGELTVRALESLFGKAENPKPDPLEIRLFESRKRYLTESDTASGKAQVWTAGFFTTADMVSRFYSRDKEGEKFGEFEFHKTLSHELTHHWIAMRYCAGVMFEGMGDRPSSELKKDLGRNENQPGHWIVEGVARFVEDQAADFKRKNGMKFDNPRVEAIRNCAGAWKAGFGIPIARYMEISPKAFDFLDRGRETQVFYDQGGALSFFMMNHRGQDGRTRFVQYLRDVYAGKMKAESWKNLGFASAAELEKEFRAFLAGVK